MDFDSFVRTLQGTFDSNDRVRSHSEELLQQLKKTATEGVPALVFSVLTQENISFHVQQAASIFLKNYIHDVDYSRMCDGDKAVLKESTFSVIIASNELCRRQLLEVIKEVVRIEFPTGVPDLIPSVLEGLGTDDLSVIICSLSVFRVIAKVCSFRPHEERLSLFDAVAVVFPMIESLMEYLFSSVFADMENLKDAEMCAQVGDVLVLIMKCFYNSTNLELGPYFLDENVFDRWSNYMAQVIQTRPMQGKFSDITDTHHPLWIAKKWTLSILFRMFVRHGNPHFCSDDCKPFADRFQTHYAPLFCELLLGVLFNSSDYPHMAPKVLTGIFNFFGHAVQHGRSHMVVMPHAQRLLFDHVFPHICFREEDHELWVNDPVEFVQRQYDIFEEFDSLPHSAVSFFSEFSHTRATVVLPIVETMMRILEEHEQSPAPTTKYGALKLFGTLNEVIVKKKFRMKNKIEGMLGRYVVPELNSSEPYLRAIACWTLQRYSSIEFQTDVLEAAVMGIHQLMGDEHLPVRAEAGIALQHFMKNESVKDYLKPNIAFILEQYLHLMEEIENDHLISALEEIIRLFGDDITPFAVELMKRLIASFQKLIIEEDENDENSFRQNFAATSCLSAVVTLLAAVQGSKETIIELEAILLPLLEVLCKPENIDYLDDALSIFSVLTFVPNAVSDGIWAFFPVLHDLFISYATDYFEAFLPIFDNYISVGKDRFLSGIEGQPNYYKDAIFNIISKVMDPTSDLHGMERSLWEPVKLIEVILQNCKGSIDDYLPQYLRMTVQLLSTLRKNSTRTLFYNVIGDAFLYNAQMTAQILMEDGVLDDVLSSWLNQIPSLKREYDKRVWILGLSAVLDAIPCDVLSVDRVEPIISGCLQIFKSIETGMNEGEGEEGGDGDDYGSGFLVDAYRSLTGGARGGDGEDAEEVADEEDIFTTDDRVYLEALKSKLEAAKNGMLDDDDTYSLQSGDEYVTPFDEVNEAQTFCGVVEEMKNRFQSVGADLQSLVSEETFEMLMEFIAVQQYNAEM